MQGLGGISVAVNVSGRQFLHSEFVTTVEAALHASGLPASRLELEFTESLPMGSPEKSATLMRALKKTGVLLSFDDFGTGYSSLSYLKRLPIDEIKIDRSFVFDMADSEESLAIVQAIIAMAHRLRLTVVAEGVETRQRLAMLAEQGCDKIQGYYFSKPLNAMDCAALLRSEPRLVVEREVCNTAGG